jgi:pimeloyl-ACP methyl ester carboxylesterase
LSTEARQIQIPAGDVTLAADAFGDTSCTPLVLLHGGGQTRHAWRSTGRELADAGWYAISVDLHRHGQSGWSADGRYFWHWDPAFLKTATDQAVQRDNLIDPSPPRRRRHGLRIPTLLIRGGQSDVLSPADAQKPRAASPSVP